MKTSQNPLTVSISEVDVINLRLIDELVVLRAYLNNPADFEIGQERLVVYNWLGLQNGDWDDLIVLGFRGAPIMLPPISDRLRKSMPKKSFIGPIDGKQIKDSYLLGIVRGSLKRIKQKSKLTSHKVVDKKSFQSDAFPNHNTEKEIGFKAEQEINKMYVNVFKKTLRKLKKGFPLAEHEKY